jgi:integrase
MATFRKRAGRWQARVSNIGQSTVSKTFDTKTDAERWARSLQRDIDLGDYKPATLVVMAVNELVLIYLDKVVPRLRGAHTERYRLATISRMLGPINLAALTSTDIAKFRDRRLKEVSPSTVVRELQSLSAMLNYARREMTLQVSNPVDLVRKPTPNRARDRRLHPDEEAQLLLVLTSGGHEPNGQWRRGTRNPWIRPIVELALETAMRRSELLTLDWANIDLVNRTVLLHMTKNGDPRTVPLSSKAVRILDTLPSEKSGPVFPTSASALKHSWERACITAGIKDLHFHDLRHEATSRIALRLPNLIELASVTGHKDVRMLGRYYHPRASELAKKLG